MIARFMFAAVSFAARKGLAEPARDNAPEPETRTRARRTGIRGETYAYWYLRRQRYVMIARNYTAPGWKGEIDLVGYDGPVLAFVEVKTRTENAARPRPEQSVNAEKERVLARMAGQFLRARRLEGVPHRFDVIAIESRPGARPVLRLHKGAFTSGAPSSP
ncbi:MAG: YraN family protein [Acidobacteriota bacterium]|nr:YraN family protein [Acidobacteriota bacterium]MDE3169800.1 YraN family protein [Acidobacteriota bacterium]